MFLFMRMQCSNYRNMQYWLSSNHIFIINPSYDVHHVHESQLDGMDHQWFQWTISTDIRKMTSLYIISHYIYDYYLSSWYILWCGNVTTLSVLKEPDFLSCLCYLTRMKSVKNIILAVLLIDINCWHDI